MDIRIMQAVQGLFEEGSVVQKIADVFFLFCSFFAEEAALLIVILFIYWCYNKKAGEAMLFNLYLATASNAIIKDIVKRPRPFIKHPNEIRYVESEGLVDTVKLRESYSFTSGHSQCAASFWPSFAINARKISKGKAVNILTVFAVAIIPLMMTSRVYLGVHYPSDVIVGALIGLVIAFLGTWVFYKFYDHRIALFSCIFVITLASLFFIDATADTYKTFGTGFGGLFGIIFEHKYVNFSTDGTKLKKFLRLLIGVALIMAIRLTLKAILPEEEHIWLGFVRYTAIGFTGTFLYPLCFKKLKLQ